MKVKDDETEGSINGNLWKIIWLMDVFFKYNIFLWKIDNNVMVIVKNLGKKRFSIGKKMCVL